MRGFSEKSNRKSLMRKKVERKFGNQWKRFHNKPTNQHAFSRMAFPKKKRSFKQIGRSLFSRYYGFSVFTRIYDNKTRGIGGTT